MTAAAPAAGAILLATSGGTSVTLTKGLWRSLEVHEAVRGLGQALWRGNGSTEPRSMGRTRLLSRPLPSFTEYLGP